MVRPSAAELAFSDICPGYEASNAEPMVRMGLWLLERASSETEQFGALALQGTMLEFESATPDERHAIYRIKNGKGFGSTSTTIDVRGRPNSFCVDIITTTQSHWWVFVDDSFRSSLTLWETKLLTGRRTAGPKGLMSYTEKLRAPRQDFVDWHTNRLGLYMDMGGFIVPPREFV